MIVSLTLDSMLSTLHNVETVGLRGKVRDVIGTVIRVTGIQPRLGELCHIVDHNGRVTVCAEVISFAGKDTLLSPLDDLDGLAPGMEVHATGTALRIALGDALLGRVLDGLGGPLDGGVPLKDVVYKAIHNNPPNPLKRKLLREIFHTGVRAIDALATCALGQRVVIVAPAGVGKSTLMGMIASQADCDVTVVALIGERGREVSEFVNSHLTDEARSRTILVAATSDRPAIERVKAAAVATRIAEHFRDQGKRVLLLVDSLTRLARAQRELGLAVGEPPARRGYPPSVFAMLPRLLERAGPSEIGTITAFYTVLTEDEETADPIAEDVISIVDGHIMLSRRLAERQHYPAIDVLRSVSRTMVQIVPPRELLLAQRTRLLLSKLEDVRLLIKVGEYKSGIDRDTDLAIEREKAMTELLVQAVEEPLVDREKLIKRLIDATTATTTAAEPTT
jgi:ATP synthase in type III secretion protein N